MNLLKITLEEAFEKLEKAHTEVMAAQAQMEKWLKDTESIAVNIRDEQVKAEKALKDKVEPMNRKLTRLQRKMQNKQVASIRATILKHELEGIVKHLGGKIPDEYKVELPEPIEEETVTEQIERELAEGKATIKPMFKEFEDKPKIITKF